MIDRGIALVGIALAIIFGVLPFSDIEVPNWISPTGFGLGIFLFGVAVGLWIRRRNLAADDVQQKNGIGGDGGSGKIRGNRGEVIGGKGGRGGVSGTGGKGGGGDVEGDDATIVGGDGGDAASEDGRGGRGAMSPLERMGHPTDMWVYGRGGAAANDPEYDRRIKLLKQIRLEYLKQFSDMIPFVEAGVEQVPINWVNKRLEELNEKWEVAISEGGYILPPLKNKH